MLSWPNMWSVGAVVKLDLGVNPEAVAKTAKWESAMGLGNPVEPDEWRITAERDSSSSGENRAGKGGVTSYSFES